MFFKWLIVVTLFGTITQAASPGVGGDHVRHRSPRAVKHWGVFDTVGTIGRLMYQQYNETSSALSRVYWIFANSFSDTATPKPPELDTLAPSTTTNGQPNATTATTTTTEAYRISRNELGRLLGKNYRGLQKLFQLELNDALNQSRYNVQDYKREFGNAVAPYLYRKPITKN